MSEISKRPSPEVATAEVATAEVAALVKDLSQTRRVNGWIRILGMGTLSLGLIALTLLQSNPVAFVFLGILAGFAYASFMILTHDAIHHTLTCSKIWDEVLPRLMSWPLLWPHGTYSAIHMIHHKMNGRSADDPERVHLTEEEYEKLSFFGRIIARNQLLYKVMFAGGLGMIVTLLSKAARVAKRSRKVRREVLRDLIGITFTVTVILGSAIFAGSLFKVLALWIILERTVGGIQQLRAHIEHYGLWTARTTFLESQMYNCRNIQTNPVTSFFFNNLNYHSVHHAFPSIPFYNLKEAHERIQAYCDARGYEPMIEEKGYAKVAFSIIRRPTFIKPDPRGDQDSSYHA